MFWWGRVNAIIAILAVVSGIVAVLNGAWAMLVVLWALLIVLRIALNAVNALWIREIAAADYTQLMEITQKLENMLHRIEPEPEDSPSP